MKSNRPRLKIPFSTLEKTGEACSLSAMGLSAIVIGTQWTSMPEAIPIHFSFAGAIDGMGPKSSLFLLLCIMTSIYLLLTFLSQFPHLFNYP
ncbi:MAG: DUF1648 domain-containing protein, partial [Proteobacteria bacterium]|nr:DUF1648 domain-containing protein [Pseudomonadota bacterium]